MPSLKGFVHFLLTRLHNVSRGCGISSKFTLLTYALIRTIPNIIERYYSRVSAIKKKLTRTLIKRIVIKYKGCGFYLVDTECLGMLSDKFENWAWDYLKIPKDGVFITRA